MTAEPIDLQRFRDEIVRPDTALNDEAAARQKQLITPAGSLGRLETLGAWLTSVQDQCPPRPLERVRVVVFAGDHGVAARDVSPNPQDVTAQMLRAVVDGRAAVNALAHTCGATVRVVDMSVATDVPDLPDEVTRYKVRRATGDIAVEDAMTADETATAFAAGVAIADAEIDAGADLLIPGDLGVANSTTAATLIGILSSRDAGGVTGRGSGITDEMWIRKAAAIRDAMRRGRPVRGDQLALVAMVGGPDFAAMTGFLLQAAVRRTPVVLDGLAAAASAMLAHRIAYRSAAWWQAAHASDEPAHALAIARLQLEPLLDYRLQVGEGAGALVAVPLLRAAQAALADIATFDEAQVWHPPEAELEEPEPEDEEPAGED